MEAEEKREFIRYVDLLEGGRKAFLERTGMSRATYYKWRKRLDREGLEGFAKPRKRNGGSWNQVMESERMRIVEIARRHPELSPRLLAVRITDEAGFSVSETTVYRILKEEDLIAPRPMPEMPAAKEWRHKTKRPDEIYQCDGTNFFVVGWGYYKLIPVEDDYSRKVLGWDLKPDETGFSIADVVEIAIENARKEGHLEDGVMPALYTDNGPGFSSDVVADYLKHHGIRHIFGTPYHPQGRGKIERLNRTMKEKVCLVVYTTPTELKAAIAEAFVIYNARPHESLQNVSPNDVYAGRKEEILKRRAELKKLTIERRKQYNLQKRARIQAQTVR
jgi:transposase InsO family protein